MMKRDCMYDVRRDSITAWNLSVTSKSKPCELNPYRTPVFNSRAVDLLSNSLATLTPWRLTQNHSVLIIGKHMGSRPTWGRLFVWKVYHLRLLLSKRIAYRMHQKSVLCLSSSFDARLKYDADSAWLLPVFFLWGIFLDPWLWGAWSERHRQQAQSDIQGERWQRTTPQLPAAALAVNAGGEAVRPF